MKAAYIFHGINWRTKNSCIKLQENISLCKFKGSKVEKIYHKLCKMENIDDGDPYDYETYALFEDGLSNAYTPKSPIAPISFLSSVITINLKSPIGMYRKIVSYDDFASCQWTDMEYYYTEQTNEFLSNAFATSSTIDDDNILEIRDTFNNIFTKSKDFKINNPFVFIIAFYFDAWTSNYLDQACVNLSIVLEALFSPFSTNELSHQIAYNFCWFLGKDTKNRKELYVFCKKYYNLRSKIVHGHIPNQAQLVELVPTMFNNVSEILKKILTDHQMIKIFSNKKLKKEYFDKLIFNHGP